MRAAAVKRGKATGAARTGSGSKACGGSADRAGRGGGVSSEFEREPDREDSETKSSAFGADRCDGGADAVGGGVGVDAGDRRERGGADRPASACHPVKLGADEPTGDVTATDLCSGG